MIDQELSEASSNMPMTICTGTLAWAMRRRIDSCSATAGGLRGQGTRQELRQALRPHGARINARHPQARLEQQLRGAPAARRAIDALREAQRRRPVGADRKSTRLNSSH